jgi:small subunit ribosomal protein S6
MKRYETIMIIDSDLSEDNRHSLLERLKDIISHQAGLLVHLDDWGIRKLAYEVKKKYRGHYIRLDFCGRGTLVEELERNLRIDDRILKFITVLLAGQVDMDQIREEMMQAEAEAATVTQEHDSRSKPMKQATAMAQPGEVETVSPSRAEANPDKQEEE